MSQNENQEADAAERSNRPDPYFKLFTQLEAARLGIQAKDTELQYSPRVDLVLRVRPGLSLENTMFDFFRTINVVEFKSENDPLTVLDFRKITVRTELVLFREEEEPENALTVIVSSRLPEKFFGQARQRRIPLWQEEGKPWLWRAEVGFQDVAIIVCRDLPIEAKYYNWLVFAPSDVEMWPEFVNVLYGQGEWELLYTIKKMRPKELEMAFTTSGKDINQIAREMGIDLPETDPEEEKRIQREMNILKLQREWTEAIIQVLDPEGRTASVPLTKRLSLLHEEATAFGAFKRFVEGIMAGLTPEERLVGLTPEQRLMGLTLEELLAGLTPEKRQELLKRLSTLPKKETE